MLADGLNWRFGSIRKPNLPLQLNHRPPPPPLDIARYVPAPQPLHNAGD